MDGILIIDKPAGLTSHDVVARVRRITRERRAGHTGTLDPFATGVLVVLLGRATRLAQFLSGAEKEYQAVIRFGYATDTGDATGVRKSQLAQTRKISEQEVEVAMALFSGEIEQIPPMHSAKKIDGRKLYELARRGEQVERKPVRVLVREFQANLLRTNEDATQDLEARVVCSAGTYVRVLAEDLGKSVGVDAHLAELRRTRAGDFRIGESVTLDVLDQMSQSNTIDQRLIPPNLALAHLPEFELDADDLPKIRHGVDLQISEEQSDWPSGQPVRLRNHEGDLIAVGICDQNLKTIHPKVVLATD